MSSLRFYPIQKDHSYYEHMGRYQFAKGLVSGLNVLDISSGEGYGSALLAESAKHVTGADIDSEIVSFANQKYQMDNLEFVVADGTALPFRDRSFDAVVSFETIEHVYEQEQFLSELRRVLKEDGMLIISTPDTYEYSVLRHYHNEDHVREFTRDEYCTFLMKHFPVVQMYGQRMLKHSLIWEMNQFPETVKTVPVEPDMQPKAMYMIAVCGNVCHEASPIMFGDKCADQEFERAAQGLHELEQERDRARVAIEDKDQQLMVAHASIEDLKQQLAASSSANDDLKAQLNGAKLGMEDKNRQLSASAAAIEDLKGQLAASAAAIEDLKGQLVRASAAIEDQKRQLSVASTTIDDQKEQLSAASTAIDDLKGQLSAASTAIDDLKGQLSAASTAIDDQKGQLERLKDALEEKKVEIKSLRHSH